MSNLFPQILQFVVGDSQELKLNKLLLQKQLISQQYQQESDKAAQKILYAKGQQLSKAIKRLSHKQQTQSNEDNTPSQYFQDYSCQLLITQNQMTMFKQKAFDHLMMLDFIQSNKNRVCLHPHFCFQFCIKDIQHIIFSSEKQCYEYFCDRCNTFEQIKQKQIPLISIFKIILKAHYEIDNYDLLDKYLKDFIHVEQVITKMPWYIQQQFQLNGLVCSIRDYLENVHVNTTKYRNRLYNALKVTCLLLQCDDLIIERGAEVNLLEKDIVQDADLKNYIDKFSVQTTYFFYPTLNELSKMYKLYFKKYNNKEDIQIKPQLIHSRYLVECLSETSDLVTYTVTEKLDFLPCKQDKIPIKFQYNQYDSEENKLLKRIINFFQKSYDYTNNQLIIQKAVLFQLIQDINLHFNILCEQSTQSQVQQLILLMNNPNTLTMIHKVFGDTLENVISENTCGKQVHYCLLTSSLYIQLFKQMNKPKFDQLFIDALKIIEEENPIIIQFGQRTSQVVIETQIQYDKKIEIKRDVLVFMKQHQQQMIYLKDQLSQYLQLQQQKTILQQEHKKQQILSKLQQLKALQTFKGEFISQKIFATKFVVDTFMFSKVKKVFVQEKKQFKLKRSIIYQKIILQEQLLKFKQLKLLKQKKLQLLQLWEVELLFLVYYVSNYILKYFATSNADDKFQQIISSWRLFMNYSLTQEGQKYDFDRIRPQSTIQSRYLIFQKGKIEITTCNKRTAMTKINAVEDVQGRSTNSLNKLRQF
ncbi:Hypothetical_protein [Hexamita inflata]|uniref:Hypothetical_protein n=1 Tax=Hexamita inflata TaxID=28002 RepID=A0AA86V681_9EUKA|nr:Hypothetical protein HINF_LOCUS45498 [Hexamita inflata]